MVGDSVVIVYTSEISLKHKLENFHINTVCVSFSIKLFMFF